MTTQEILKTSDPNLLRSRLGQIDNQIGALQSERAFVDRRFQTLLAKNAPRQQDLSIRPDRHERLHNGLEDCCELNNSERTVLNGLSRD